MAVAFNLKKPVVVIPLLASIALWTAFNHPANSASRDQTFDREKKRAVLFDLNRMRPADVSRLNYVAESLIKYDAAVSGRPWISYLGSPASLLPDSLRNMLGLASTKDQYFKNILNLAQGKDDIVLVDSKYVSFVFPLKYGPVSFKKKQSYDPEILAPHWDDTILNAFENNPSLMNEAAKKLLLVDFSDIPDDHPPVKALKGEIGKFEKLTPEERDKELNRRIRAAIDNERRNEAERRSLTNKEVADAARLKLALDAERAENMLALEAIGQLATIFGSKYMSMYVAASTKLFQSMMAMEGGAEAGAFAAGNEYWAIAIFAIQIVGIINEMQKPQTDPVLEGLKQVLEEIKAVREQIADLGRHLDLKLDIFFGAVFEELTKIELQLGSIDQRSIEIQDQLNDLADRVTNGFREIKQRELDALMLKCFDDPSIIGHPVVSEEAVSECLKTFATNLLKPSRELTTKGFPELKGDFLWPYSENAEAFRLWLVDFATQQKLEERAASLKSLGTIPNASSWSFNADALSRLVEEHPWKAVDVLRNDVAQRAAKVGRHIIEAYDALGPRKLRGGKQTLGESLLFDLIRVSKDKHVEFLASVEKNPWEFAPGKFNPRLGEDQVVAAVPEFTKGPLFTCEKYKKERATGGFSMDAKPFNWRDVVPQGDPGKIDFALQAVNPKPVQAEIESAFNAARMPLPAGIEKKLPSWALNAEIVSPGSLIACVSSVAFSKYAITIPDKIIGVGVFAFDLNFTIDVWLTWSDRETPVSEPRAVAALVSRQEYTDRVGRSGAACLWQWPQAEGIPPLLLNGTWSYAADGHSGNFNTCSPKGAIKDHWSDVVERASPEEQKAAREKAAEWVAAKLKEQRENGIRLAALNFKSNFEAIQQVRAAFSAMLQVGFWPQVMSDQPFRMLVEDISAHLDIGRNFNNILAGKSSSDEVAKALDADLAKLQKWMDDPSRNFKLPGQTISLRTTVERLEEDQRLFVAAGG